MFRYKIQTLHIKTAFLLNMDQFSYQKVKSRGHSINTQRV